MKGSTEVVSATIPMRAGFGSGSLGYNSWERSSAPSRHKGHPGRRTTIIKAPAFSFCHNDSD